MVPQTLVGPSLLRDAPPMPGIARSYREWSLPGLVKTISSMGWPSQACDLHIVPWKSRNDVLEHKASDLRPRKMSFTPRRFFQASQDSYHAKNTPSQVCQEPSQAELDFLALA